MGEFGEKIYRFIRQNLRLRLDDGTSDFNSHPRRSYIHCHSPCFNLLLRFTPWAAGQSLPARYLMSVHTFLKLCLTGKSMVETKMAKRAKKAKGPALCLFCPFCIFCFPLHSNEKTDFLD